uniref:Myb-like protein X n=1 Tax=Diabrotica virgifera virgifera TaxID=50390 RepID=A0A6P7GY92_DIAVI
MVKKIEKIVEKSAKQEIEIKEIKINMKEIKNGQKKELENLENKLENAIQTDIEEVERKIKENERKIAEINTQQNVGQRREMVIHSTDDVKIRFGGDVRRLHSVPFINSVKKKVQHIGNFETAKEMIRNHLKYEAVELIARHFEETLEDHITLQNYKDIDSLCQFLQIRESRLRERKSRRSQEDYRPRETQDCRDRRQNNRRDYTRRDFNPRRENENRDNGRGNYEQRNRQWNEDRNRDNQNRNTTRTNQENRNNGRQNEQGYRENRNRSDKPRENRRE